MKKVAFLALALSMVLSMQAGAATIGVPWFVDNAPAGATLPPANNQATTIVYLNNSDTIATDCAIAYYDANGNFLAITGSNTFSIPAQATLGFRPVADDQNTTANPLGQESAAAAAIPNRPRPTNSPGANGSLVITYDDQGGTVRITGKAETWGSATLGGATVALNSAYLLPG